MNTPIIVWCCIIGLVAVVVILNFISAVRRHRNCCHNLLEIGSEREVMYVPGDELSNFSSDNDYDDFEDL